MRRIVAIASAALMTVPLSIGAAVGVADAAEAAPTHASGGSPEIGGDEGPLGMAGVDRDEGDKKQSNKKKERREQGSSGVAGIGPGDNPVEEGQDSVPDTNGLSTGDGPVDTDGVGTDGGDDSRRHYDNRGKGDGRDLPFDRPGR